MNMKPLRRRLTLSHHDRSFLERWGLVHERFGGFYLHHIVDADPGFDVHDHPWSFVSIVLRGGYTEEHAADARTPERTLSRTWRAGTLHRMPLNVAHRITAARPGTWTLVFRGPTRRVWGFYIVHPFDGHTWDPWTAYDYAQRRANTVISNQTDHEMEHG
jgi:hypothetical protein